jgi:hypothetical protein
LLKLLAIVGDFYPLISLYIWSWWSTEGTHLRARKQAGCEKDRGKQDTERTKEGRKKQRCGRWEPDQRKSLKKSFPVQMVTEYLLISKVSYRLLESLFLSPKWVYDLVLAQLGLFPGHLIAPFSQKFKRASVAPQRRRSSTYCSRAVCEYSHSARSQGRASAKTLGLSLNPWGRTVHVTWPAFWVGSSKAKIGWL